MNSELENKLIELGNLYIEKIDFDFDWNFKNGLRYVSDESLELAYEILKKMKISLELKDNKIIILNNMYSICDNKYTTNELIDNVKNSNMLFKNNKAEFGVRKDLTLDRVCHNCKFQKCPKHLAGYIFYLINKGLLEQKLKDRRNFREKVEVNDNYSFEWKYGDILKMISDDMYSFCYEIVKKDLIYVEKYLVDNEKSVKIYSAFSCLDYKLSFGNINKISVSNKEFKNWDYIRRSPDLEINLCRTYDCDMNGCPLAIAGVIQYLLNSGKENILIEERKYYKEHQEQMDKKLKDIIEKHNKETESNINKSLESLKKYENKIDKFNDLISLLINQNQDSLHCSIEGDDFEERRNIINSIMDFLCSNKKINTISKISFQNLAAGNAYSLTEKTEELDQNGVYYRIQDAMKYTTLKENHIYIVNNISEFIEDYEKHVKGNGSEIKKKQLKHIIDLLTQINKSYYIIFDCTTKEMDQLITLEPKLQYIYQNSRYRIPEFSLDDAFKLYEKNLDNDILKKLIKDENKYKKQFIDYISLNKNFIPFNNRELAIYLAMYSNLRNDAILPDNIYKKETVEESLKNIIGLDIVKEKVKEFEKYMMFKVKAESQNLRLVSSNMHMIFTGNPGTGKTTIARIMAKMLYDMGIIKENKLIEVERKDLVAAYVGQTAIKTGEVISKAMGGLLFVDEAYSLASSSGNDYGSEAISTLIKAMEDHKDELVVIFAGYKNEMKEFLDINPGIASRIGYVFDFPDYTVNELIEMFHKKIENMGFVCEKECDVEIKKLCTYFSQRKSFGNGRFVDKLIQEIVLKHSISDNENISKINVNDIPSIREFNNENDSEETTEDLLKNVIGLESLKSKIKEFENYVKFIKEAEKKNINLPNQNMHMIFTGNPGTGKTTIARIMAKILFNAGIIHENKLVEVERKDLIAEYVGQTASKTYDVIEKAMGGILFVDEAYSLASSSKGDFGSEAIATLIKAMEDHKGQFIAIFAGYKKEMKDFIDMNSGISSRIGYTFDFPDYTREELAEILYKKIEKSNLKLQESAKKKVFEIMNYFCNVDNIGNGRFANKVFEQILLKHAENQDKDIEIIKEKDIPTIKEMTDNLFNGDRMINPDNISKEALKKTAIHEIGHALVRYKLYETPGIIKITINPEGGGTLGYVRHKTSQGEYVQKKSTLLNQIKVCLAGMCAEEVFLGEFANGNTSDLEHATSVAKNMVTRYGMSKLGFGQISDPNGAMAIKVQEEINSILSDCYTEVIEIIKQNKENMDNVVKLLLKQKEITEEEFLDVFNGKGKKK